MATVMPVVILAGGMATRLRPLTETIPKALIEVAGRPFLWHQLKLLKWHGVGHVVLAVGYLGEKIQQVFGDGADLGLRIEYSCDAPKLLGTAGAIRGALHLLPERFFVLYGDSYLNCDYRAVQSTFEKSKRRGLMTIYRNDGKFDKSNVEYSDGRILAYDKHHRTDAMRHIDYGLGAFHRSVFAAIDVGQVCDLAEVYRNLLTSGELAAFESAERFYEIGSPQGLKETAKYLERMNPASEPGDSR